MQTETLARDAQEDTDAMLRNARAATEFLKALAHEGRLMILCHLANGERTVGELEHLLGARQPAVSQQLARLRLEGLVATRREGKTIYYSIGDERVARMIGTMHALFCGDGRRQPQRVGRA
ncbi:metalloregulator ArsR/SmtB family transcription factor [soil metagenome]